MSIEADRKTYASRIRELTEERDMALLQVRRFAMAIEASEAERAKLASALVAVLESDEQLQMARAAARRQGRKVPT